MESWKCPTSLDLPSKGASATGQGTPALSLAVLGGAVAMTVEYLFPESKREELQRRLFVEGEEAWGGISSEHQSVTTGAIACTFLATVFIIL